MKSYSQFGIEDEITLDLIKRLSPPPYFVEIGAGHNGENNTHILLDQGWRGVWIDTPKHAPLLRQAVQHPNVAIVEAFATVENVCDLLYGVPFKEFGVLSIDVDGNDFWLWRAVCQVFRPFICIIECNAQKPLGLPFVAPYQPDYVWDQATYENGASAWSLKVLGTELGYSFVRMASDTPHLDSPNMFFVRNDLKVGLGQDDFYRNLTASS